MPAAKKSGGKAVAVLLSAAFFIMGISISYLLGFGGVQISFGMHPSIELALLCCAVVLLSMLFFGYLAPLVMLALGLGQGAAFAANPVVVVLLFVPLLMASYVGTIIGKFLYADIKGEDSLFEHKRLIISRFIAAVVVAAIFGFLISIMQEQGDLLALLRGLIGV